MNDCENVYLYVIWIHCVVVCSSIASMPPWSRLCGDLPAGAWADGRGQRARLECGPVLFERQYRQGRYCRL